MLVDDVVQDRVWAVLMASPSVHLFHQLRIVNKAWRQFVASTIEWNAWMFSELDEAGGYYVSAETSGLMCPSFSKRYMNEVEHFRILSVEDLDEIASRLVARGSLM